MRARLLALLFALCAVPAFAQVQPTPLAPWPGVTPPIFGGPSSGVTGSGGLLTTCLTWPLGTPLCEEAANHLFQRNTTNAQRASWANTYTGATNYEAFSIDWQTAANVARVGTFTAATGTSRNMRLMAQGTNGSANYTIVNFDRGSSSGAFIGLYPVATAALAAASDSGATTDWVTVGGGVSTSTDTSGTVRFFTIKPVYNQASGNAANTDFLVNRTQTLVGSGTQLLADFQVSNTSQLSLNNTGKITTYSAVATAGQGVDVIRAQATTGTVTNSGTASIATWTPGATDVEVEVGCRVNITVSTTHSFSCDVTYTDVANNARTRVLEMFPISGTPLTSGLMTNTVGAGDFGSAVVRLGVKASTAIVVRTSAGGTFTTVTYTASGTIKQVG